MTAELSSSRRDERALRIGDRTGSGPTVDERPIARFPGAGARFALFGEVLTTGLLVTLVALPIVTLPAALAAGIRHLRRHVAAEDSRMALFWADVRAGLLSGAVVGAVATAAAAVLLVDLQLARSGMLPGGEAVGILVGAGLVVLATGMLVAAAAWTPERGWRAAVRLVPSRVRADLAGAAYLAVAAVFVGVVTWMLTPLFIAGIGCAAFAAVAVPERRRVR